MTSLKEAGEEVASNGKTAYHYEESRPRKKMMSVEVHFLDDSISTFHIQYKAPGRVLFEEVCKMLSLLEVDYFGLEYTDDKGTKHWLDYEKLMCRQTGLSSLSPTMCFLVKFYTPDPAQLEEEYTRYLYSLQIKKNLAQGLLQCNDNTAALMASYIVQAECGDYVMEDYPDHSYLSCYKFVPRQDAELQQKIMENHKKHIGQSPAEADLNLLETARRCELYGIRVTPAKDHEGLPLNLAVAHMGILVFQNYTKINTFSWAKIRKLSFKRKRFLIKLHPEGYGYYKDTVEFFFDHRNESKNFWKKCIENHAFFRCAEVKKLPRQKPRLFSRGSSFRYSGRTQKQVVEYVRENYVQRRTFQRSVSLRVSGTTENGVGTIGNSGSDSPLIPVTTSQSCGSVALLPNIADDCISENKPISHSEPPSPFSVPDCEHGTANGNGHNDGSEDQLEDRSSQHESQEAYDTDGLRSPDYLGQDTDDNISHDSYQLEEKEAVASESNAHSSSDDLISTNVGKRDKILSVALLENGLLKEIDNESYAGASNSETKYVSEETNYRISSGKITDGDIQYVLHRRKCDNKSQTDGNRSPSLERSRIRVEINHTLIGQVSPNLYARANRLNTPSTCNHNNINSSGASYNQTVDFVHVNHLPSMGSFSSHDDSVEECSLEKEIFEQLRKKKLFETDEISVLEEKPIEEQNNKGKDECLLREADTVMEKTLRDKTGKEGNVEYSSMHVTPNVAVRCTFINESGLKNSSGKTTENSFSDVHKEESLSVSNKTFSEKDNNKLPSNLQETLLVLDEKDIVVEDGDENCLQTVFLEINQDREDIVNPHNQYSYSCYKFSQEGSIDECSSSDI